ncbi:MAG: phosphotransferase, partial [Clostridia bacterium]
RETLNIISTKDGHDFFVDTIGSYWRAYEFIVGAHTYETVEEPRDFYCSGLGFGRFQNMLSDYPADTLHETVADFHNTPMRLLKLRAALLADTCGRAASVANEVAFVLAHEADTHILMDLLSAGKLPLRVTHNDTKLNNIMIDDATREAICVIDLDTVMPGLSVNDFGDSIRFGASTATEDEPDLSKVSVDLALFEEFTRGFLKGCDGSLTDIELDMLPMGAKLMTLECGIRFLTDYLEGDCYFKISSEGQNLNRAHTQFKLVSDMERHWDELCAIVGKYRA